MGKAIWTETCFVCNGHGRISTWDKKTKKANPDEGCPGCDGKGYVMMSRYILKKN